MTQESIDDAVRLLARDAVTDLSPAELPLFNATASRYFDDPQAVLAVRPTTDEALGFGAETAVLLVGPFALELAKQVLTRLVEKTGDAAADGLAARVLGWIGGQPDRRDPVQTLDATELSLIRATTQREARRLAVPRADALRIADAVVASLATRI